MRLLPLWRPVGCTGPAGGRTYCKSAHVSQKWSISLTPPQPTPPTPSYANEIYAQQPEHHSTHVWNRLEYRALEGFVAGIPPFNFTAIGANLGATPAIVVRCCGDTRPCSAAPTISLGSSSASFPSMASLNNLPGQRRPLEAQRDGGPEQLRGLQRLAHGRHARGYVSLRFHLSSANPTMHPVMCVHLDITPTPQTPTPQQVSSAFCRLMAPRSATPS